MSNPFDDDHMLQVEKIKQLAELLADREVIIQKFTEEIFDLIEQTVLLALFELFEVPEDNITWIDAQISGRTLVVAASVEYEADRHVPHIIEQLSPSEGKTGRSVRLFRAGIPLELVFSNKEMIKTFITNTIRPTTDQAEDMTVEEIFQPKQDEGCHTAQTEFDQSLLSKDQLQQMITFQQYTRKTKH